MPDSRPTDRREDRSAASPRRKRTRAVVLTPPQSASAPRPAPICRRRRLLSLPAAKQRLLPADASTPLRRRLDATGRAAASTICPAIEAAGRAAAGHATPSTMLETQVVLAVERPAVLAVVRRGQRRTSLVSALTKGVCITEGCSVMAPCCRQCRNDAKVSNDQYHCDGCAICRVLLQQCHEGFPLLCQKSNASQLPCLLRG
ncbi:uncharacterized protein [Miscanthus floridulus]